MTCTRRLVASVCALLLGLSASRANADEAPVPSKPEPTGRAVSVAFTAAGGVMRMHASSTGFELGGAGAQVAVTYRASSTLSVGGIASHSVMYGGDRLTRVAAEGRYHFVHRRYVDVWGAAEAGVAAYLGEPPTVFIGFEDGGGAPSPKATTRFAPIGGIGAGVDLLPLRYASIGLEGRVFGSVYGYAEDGPSGLTPGAFVGLTLALHLPLEG